MEQIFNFIQTKPEYFAAIFAVVNVLWGVFLYFNKIRHTRELESLKQSLNLDLERRKKVFEMKSSSYEGYFHNVDAFHAKHKNDYQDILTPLFNDFNRKFQEAESIGDKQASTEATIWFSQEIQKITFDGFHELQSLENQTNTLKLTASDEVAQILEELKQLYKQAFDISSEQISKFVEIITQENHELGNQLQAKANELGEKVKTKSEELRQCMRLDLREI